VVTALTGDLALTRRAKSNFRWLRLKPDFLGLVCFFGFPIFFLPAPRRFRIRCWLFQAGSAEKDAWGRLVLNFAKNCITLGNKLQISSVGWILIF
jgi:hypothetical protein